MQHEELIKKADEMQKHYAELRKNTVEYLLKISREFGAVESIVLTKVLSVELESMVDSLASSLDISSEFKIHFEELKQMIKEKGDENAGSANH